MLNFSKDNNFTLLRLLLALSVVFSHTMKYTGGESFFGGEGLTIGSHAVFIFFTISGFLITMSAEKRSLKDFAISRLLRIYPGLIFLTLLIAFIGGPTFSSLTSSEYFSDSELPKFILKTITVFKSATIVPGLFEVPIGTVWTLRWEMILYIMLFILSALQLLRPRIALGIFFVCIISILTTQYICMPEKFLTAARLFLAFFLGSVIYYYRDTLQWKNLFALIMITYFFSSTFLFIPLLIITECFFGLLFALKPWKTIKIKTDISFGIYLSGWFPIKIFILYYPEPTRLELSLFALLISVVYGYISYKLIEEPALRLKKVK